MKLNIIHHLPFIEAKSIRVKAHSKAAMFVIVLKGHDVYFPHLLAETGTWFLSTRIFTDTMSIQLAVALCSRAYLNIRHSVHHIHESKHAYRQHAHSVSMRMVDVEWPVFVVYHIDDYLTADRENNMLFHIDHA